MCSLEVVLAIGVLVSRHIHKVTQAQRQLRASACQSLVCLSADTGEGRGAYRTGDKEVEGEDAYAGGQEAPPEDGGAVERGPLLNGE